LAVVRTSKQFIGETCGVVAAHVWLDEAQREGAHWSGHYHKLFRDVSHWNECLTRPPESESTGPEAERQRAFRRVFSLPDEILTVPDPLTAILAANKTVNGDEMNGDFDIG
jgi:hypothetical protein